MADGTPANTSPPDVGLSEYAAVALAWLIPGTGHLLIGQRTRGLTFLLTIHLLFAAGLLVGGIRSINPPDQPIWSVTQYLAGWPMIVATTKQKSLAAANALPLDYAPAVRDVGSVYCGIAGMLNMLVMFDVLLRVSGGRRPSLDETPSTLQSKGAP